MLRDCDDIGGDHPFPRTGGAPTSASDQASTRAGIAEAKVVRTFETKGASSRSGPKLAVEYTFTDAATGSRSERDDVPISWKIDGPTVTVEYLPGVADSSRLKGNDRSMRVYLFAASCVWLLVEGYNVWSMAHAAVHGKRRRR